MVALSPSRAIFLFTIRQAAMVTGSKTVVNAIQWRAF
jgi:hypothetical protein